MIIRPATVNDAHRIRELRAAEPSAEMIRLFGTADRARSFDERIEACIPTSRKKAVLTDGPNIFGVLEYTIGPHEHKSRRAQLHALTKTVGVFGLLLRAPKLYVRTKMELQIPLDGFHIEEVNVHPNHRGQGYGTELLIWAEEVARSRSLPQLSLCTWFPGRVVDLYERNGFHITDSVFYKQYEWLYGVQGRVLMEKRL